MSSPAQPDDGDLEEREDPPGVVVHLSGGAGTPDQDLLEQTAYAPGYVAARLRDLPPEEIRQQIPEAQRLTQALERWLRHLSIGAGGSASPRIEAGRLVREIVTRRCRLACARREELQMGTVLVLVDVSGSCAAAAPSTLAATMAFAAAHPGSVAVVVHSNGFPVELAGVAARWADKLPELRPGRPNFERLAEAMLGQLTDLAGLLVFGDWHAGDLIQACAERAPTIWLDDYAATHGVRPASKKLRSGWTARRQPVVWWQGVQTAGAAAGAVNAACPGTV